MTRGLVLLACLWALPALAQADLPDAGLPDTVVGGTGAERASEEQDTTSPTSTPCQSDNDCDRGFQCLNLKCSYRQYRDATFRGCEATPGLWLAGLVLLLRRRHFFEKFTK